MLHRAWGMLDVACRLLSMGEDTVFELSTRLLSTKEIIALYMVSFLGRSPGSLGLHHVTHAWFRPSGPPGPVTCVPVPVTLLMVLCASELAEPQAIRLTGCNTIPNYTNSSNSSSSNSASWVQTSILPIVPLFIAFAGVAVLLHNCITQPLVYI